MKRKELFRYIAGYIFGGSFFLLIIPGALYSISYFSGFLFPGLIFNDDKFRIPVSLVFFIPGIIFMIWSNTALFFAGKGGPAEGFGIEISPKTTVLVMSGPYRYTRNPMVFGAYTMYLAFSFFFNSYASLIIVLLFLPVIITYLKKSEEKRLLKDFGEDYLKFRERVSLLIPRLPKE